MEPLRRNYVHWFLLGSYLLSLLPSIAPSQQDVVRGRPVLFIFGDSILDTGNNNYIVTTPLNQANFKPYGETYFGFPTGRASDGRLMSDFIAELANLPIALPYLQPGFDQYQNGVNFASAGAGALVETFEGTAIDLKMQLRNFKKARNHLAKVMGRDTARSITSSAVFLISIGANDYLSQFLTNPVMLKSLGPSEYVGVVIGNITQGIRELYMAGGRNFAIMNVPLLGCLPGMRLLNFNRNHSGCLEEATLLGSLHNKVLFGSLLNLEKELKGFRYALPDLNTYLRDRVKDPRKYGFKSGTSACCGSGKFRGEFSCGGKRFTPEFELCRNPNEYIFWDSYHPTEETYKQIAYKLWQEPARPRITGPQSLKQLFH